METILIAGHTEADGTLPKSVFEAVTCARTLAAGLGDAAVAVGLIGKDVQDAAHALANCGASTLYGVSGDPFAQSRYNSDAAALAALCQAASATIVVCPATSRMMRVAGGVAQRLNGVTDTHVTGVAVADRAVQVTRWYYRQRMKADVQRSERPWIMTIDPGSNPPWEGEAGTAQVEAVSVDAVSRTKIEGVQAPPGDEQTIRPDAELLFVAGAGWTKKQEDGQPHVDKAEEIILDFLRKSQASLGGSKSMVDLSSEGQDTLTFMTHLNQVGQTGATPRHPKGLATCCHGEEPHVVGWRFVNERRVINSDASCGWAQGKADVLYVADAFKVMGKINELLADK